MKTLPALALIALSCLTLSSPAAAQTPDCERASGPFAWSCSRPIPGMTCTQVVETADPHTWSDNYFCSTVDLGMRWSSAGPIPGMRCTQILETADPHTWSDNYLCVPHRVPVNFTWSSAGPLPGQQCVQWFEPADPNTWADNYLCYAGPQRFLASLPPAPVSAPPQEIAQPAGGACENTTGFFSWSCSRPTPGMACTQIVEPADPHTWGDNYFCAANDLGMRWSHAGPIPGMRCTAIIEPADPNTWSDNYLCVPPMSPVVFQWSYAGPVTGLPCVQWNEPADPHTWNDNFLCWAGADLSPRNPFSGGGRRVR
jgi:hypothetical protein